MKQANTLKSRGGRHASPTNGRHSHLKHGEEAGFTDLVGERAARALHEAIDYASEKLRDGEERIVNGGTALKKRADERICERPLTSVAIAFGAGVAACAAARLFRSGR